MKDFEESKSAEGFKLSPPSEKTISLVFKRIVPILFLAYMMNFVDRSNISMVKASLQADIGVGPIAYGMGSGLFFLTYCFLQFPSNLLLRKIGAHRLLGGIITLWGIVSMLMSLANGVWSFFALRLLLGAVESGFYAGVLYFFTRWFPHAQRAKANSLFLAGAAVANIVGNPLAALLVGLQGVGGLRGWQWLFVLEGVPALIIGIIILTTLADSPSKAKWLGSEEGRNLEAYIAQQDEEGSSSVGNSSWHDALKDRQVLLTIVILFSVVIGVYSDSYYLPAIISHYAHLSTLQVGLLTAIPYAFTAIALWVVPRIVKPGFATKVWIIGSVAAVSVGFILGVTSGLVVGIIGFCIAQAATQICQPLVMANISMRFKGAVLAGTIAVVNMIVQLGGFFGPNILGFMEQRTGSPSAGLWFVIVFCLITASLGFALKISNTAENQVAEEEKAEKAG